MPSGELWVSRSNIGWGFLDELDAVTGRLEKRFVIAAGTEGIVFDQGRQIMVPSRRPGAATCRCAIRSFR